MDDSWYDTAQICTNGHIITPSLIKNPQQGREFCLKCEASTITKCQECDEIIKGIYHVFGAIDIRRFAVPNFCHTCGKPYPWTKARLKDAKKLSGELDKLKDDERELLKKYLDDIIRDTPQAAIAATQFNRLIAKTGKPAEAAFKNILLDIVSETAKKIIWPS